MKVIFCIDKKNGMMLFGKRQSQDRILRAKLIEMAGEERLFMSEYSAKQFADQSQDKICVIKTQSEVEDNGYYFVEDKDYSLDGVEEVILCNWNRSYPADKVLKIDLKGQGFNKMRGGTEEIKGSSHDKITIERYIK